MLKYLFLFSTLIIGSTLSSITYAGGPDSILPPVASPPPTAKVRGPYIDAGFGLAITRWDDAVKSLTHTAEWGFNDNKKGGFVYGGDLGYQFNHLLSLEAGYYNLPHFNSYYIIRKNGEITDIIDWYHVNSDFLYGAGKVSLPFFIDRLTVFGKLGVAFHNLKRIAIANSLKAEPSYTSPLVAAGLQYYFGDSLNMSLQYITTPGMHDQVNGNPIHGYVDTPTAYLILLNIGYRFNI